jgi:hypothetical protein
MSKIEVPGSRLDTSCYRINKTTENIYEAIIIQKRPQLNIASAFSEEELQGHMNCMGTLD